MTALSVLPYCNAGWDVRVAGRERCAPPPRMYNTHIGLYLSDFPTVLSRPSCPRIYLPPPPTPGWDFCQEERRYWC